MTAPPELLAPQVEALPAVERVGEQEVHSYQLEPGLLHELGLPELPPGYGFSGGAARAIAQAQLWGESAIIRDVDVVPVEELLPPGERSHAALDTTVIEGESLTHSVDSMAAYFGTRDLTCNEVIVIDGRIMLSRRGEEDLARKIIRPTDYETRLFDGCMGPKLATKALLLAAVFEDQYDQATLALPEGQSFNSGHFFLALSLNKALQYGLSITNRFLDKLHYYGQVSAEDVREPFDLAIALKSLTGFIFRGSIAADAIQASDFGGFDTTPLKLDERYDYFGAIKNRATGKKGVRFRPQDEA